MGLIYAPNTTRWHVGDFVIHDADAKRADMLMVVTGCSREGDYRTRYAFPEEQPRSWRRKVSRITLPPLHDLGRFGFDVPHLPVMPAASASSPRQAGVVHAQREGTQARDPRARERAAVVRLPAQPA